MRAPSRLRCEYLDDPIGIDTSRPRLSWWLNDARPAELQTGYRIQVASSAAALEAGDPDLWDSGHVASRENANIEYRGRALRSRDRAWWRVRCHDSDGISSAWSATARFELGLLEAGDWQARWIAAPLTGSPVTTVPAPLLFRDFDLPGEPARARLYIAALGAAAGEINGRALCSAVPLASATELRRRVPYHIHDVTGHLCRGHNRMALILGDGDWCGHTAGGRRQRYGIRPAVCAQLMVELDADEQLVVGTDAAWRWVPSWLLRADRDAGEEVDGRQWRAGWSRPGRALEGNPVVEETFCVERFAQARPAALRTAGLDAPAAPQRTRTADGRVKLRFDFGRSVLGRVRLELRAPPDSVVTVRYGDVPPFLAGESPAERSAPRWEAATDRYTARGDGVETFEPRFAVHAFRYAEVDFDAGPAEVTAATALELGSGTAGGGVLRSDHRLVEALFRAADRTLDAGLALGPVTALSPPARRLAGSDCEAIFAGGAACRDVAALLHGWLAGLTDADDVEPLLPCLWLGYRCHGDRRLLERLFPAVQNFLGGVRERSPGLVGGSLDGSRPVAEQMLQAATYAYSLSIAARMAGVLGRLDDLEHYRSVGALVRTAFRERFVTPGGLLVGDDQLAYILALALGMLEGGERAVALARVEDQLRSSGFHLDVDVRHGALLLEVLTLEGRADLAYQVLLQTTAPGWLHPLLGGAELLWDERHALPGRLAAASVAGWLQRFMLGMEVDHDLTPDLNAYRRMRIQPRPPIGPTFAAGPPVREVSGHLDTLHGRYECGWRIADERFELGVRVPGNCDARVVLPDGTERLVVAGAHEFSISLDGLAGRARDAGDGIPVLQEVS